MQLKYIFKLIFVFILLTIYILVFGIVSLSDHMRQGKVITRHEEDLQGSLQPG